MIILKYAVDKIENDIVVLENIKTGEVINESKDNISINVKERDIIIFRDGKYFFDDIEKLKRINMLREKMNRLKK